MELHTGAAGKVLLAFAPPEVQAKVLNKGTLKKLTPNTITDPEKLARELEAIRRRGYAFSAGERVSDVWSVTAPVFDHEGKICGAIGITGPAYRIPKRLQLKYKEIVVQESLELSRRLGWQGPRGT